MSSIPSSKMKHAHVHHDEPAAAADAAGDNAPASAADSLPAAAPKPGKGAKAKSETLTDQAREYAEEALEVVKARPKTFAAIGAAVVAGAAAIVALPAFGKAKPAPAKKPAKRAPAKPRSKA